MTKLNYKTAAQAKRETGLSYIGATNSSAKILKNEKYNELTYIIYLAPANLSGYEVCPKRTEECTHACLFGSGQVIMDKTNRIVESRIKKTQMFFTNRDYFMAWVVKEIEQAKAKAEKKNMKFSVRINGTSDLQPTLFKHDGKVLFDIFPDVQFYDYTKVDNRFRLLNTYKNYDLTFSYSGHNWNECEDILNNESGRVAVVFEKNLPETYKGYKVIDGDAYDMRYVDDKNVIVGLKFKRVKNKVEKTNNAFIVAIDDINRNK
jgi:hypothetical protein